MSLAVRAGDVFFTSGASLLGHLIRWAERDPGEEPTWANHVGVVVSSGWLVPPGDYVKGAGLRLSFTRPERTDLLEAPLARTVEALWKVEHTRWWERHRGDHGSEVEVWRHRGLTPAETARVTGYLIRHVGDSYGWHKLLFHLADRLVFKGQKTLSRLLRVDRRPICSYLVARAFEIVSVHFGMPAVACDPDEMHDFCRKHEQWQLVGKEKVNHG